MGSWFAYLQAGKAFAGVVQGLYDERTMVWVHGYELIPCLPQLARKLHATGTRVGFSLHRPFPSSEIFRTLSVRVELLRAILSANLITFHLYEYVRHFTTCCRRILGLDDESVGAGEIYLDVDGRRVYILALHGGLDPDHVMRSLRFVFSVSFGEGHFQRSHMMRVQKKQNECSLHGSKTMACRHGQEPNHDRWI